MSWAGTVVGNSRRDESKPENRLHARVVARHRGVRPQRRTRSAPGRDRRHRTRPSRSAQSATHRPTGRGGWSCQTGGCSDQRHRQPRSRRKPVQKLVALDGACPHDWRNQLRRKERQACTRVDDHRVYAGVIVLGLNVRFEARLYPLVRLCRHDQGNGDHGGHKQDADEERSVMVRKLDKPLITSRAIGRTPAARRTSRPSQPA